MNLEKQSELLSVLKKECRHYEEIQSEVEVKTNAFEKELEKSQLRCHGICLFVKLIYYYICMYVFICSI